MNEENELYMQVALSEAHKALKNGDVPVGAVIVKNGKILTRAYNLKEKKKNACYHAEILAIEKACKKIRNFRLIGCTIYVTKEPCLMCMGAILSARMDKVVFGSYDKKFGSIGLCKENNFNHTCDYEGGVLEQQTNALLSGFFSDIRKKRPRYTEK